MDKTMSIAIPNHLTDKQKVFAKEYLQDFNASQAAT